MLADDVQEEIKQEINSQYQIVEELSVSAFFINNKE